MDQHDELVSANARDGVARASRGSQTLSHRRQDQVPERVPVAVIERLELVEVDEEQRHAGPAPAGSLQRHSEPVQQELAVGQACELIVEGDALDLGLGKTLLGDVGKEHGDHAPLALIRVHLKRPFHAA